MKSNTQNAKIAAITEKTMIVGIDVGSETHFARAFDWRNYEYSRKPLEFNNNEEGFETFLTWINEMKTKHGKTEVIPGMEPTGIMSRSQRNWMTITHLRMIERIQR